MAIRNRWRFGGGLVATLTLCVVVYSQQAPTAPPLPPPDQSSYPDRGAAIPATQLPTPPPAAKRQTVEDLIAAIKAIRAQKAELERKEQALAATLRMRVEEQGKQLADLGITQHGARQPATPTCRELPYPLLAPTGVAEVAEAK